MTTTSIHCPACHTSLKMTETPPPGVPKRGRIALQHHGDPVQFANIFVKELE